MFPRVVSFNTLLGKISSETDLERATPAYRVTPAESVRALFFNAHAIKSQNSDINSDINDD
jgi:hypothetical protein